MEEVDRGVNMTWNYRVYKCKEKEEEYYAIHEAYYAPYKEEPHSYTVDPVAPMGNTLEELRSDLQMMLAALDKPVIDYPHSDKKE